MKLSKLLNEAIKTGTYVGVKFDSDTIDTIINLTELLNIPNPINKDEIHMTIMYSRKFLPNYKPLGNIDENSKPIGFHIFDTFDNKRALVLKLDCNWAVSRHKTLMTEHDALYDYPEFIPHITLSYDIGDIMIPKNKYLPNTIFKINKEYSEDLKLEWKPK